MKKLPNTPFNKQVDFSIITLLSALAMQQLALYAAAFMKNQKYPTDLTVVLLTLLIVSVGIGWAQMLRTHRIGFAFGVIACGATYIVLTLNRSLFHANKSASIHKILSFTLSPYMLLTFSITVFFVVYFLRSEAWQKNAHGTFLIAVGVSLLSSAITGLLLGNGSLGTILFGFIGVGCLAKEIITGVFLPWILLAILVIPYLSRGHSIADIVFLFSLLCGPSALGVVMNTFLKNEFSRNLLKMLESKHSATSSSYRSSGYYSQFSSSKSCGACGRNVSLAARAGERCPHCGSFWSFERKLMR